MADLILGAPDMTAWVPTIWSARIIYVGSIFLIAPFVSAFPFLFLVGLATSDWTDWHSFLWLILFSTFVLLYVLVNGWSLFCTITLRASRSAKEKLLGTLILVLGASMNAFVGQTLGIEEELSKTAEQTLSEAIWKDDVIKAERVLRQGVDANKMVNGWTPLGAAARVSPGAVRLLMAHGANVDQAAHDLGDKPLAVAAYWGRPDVVRLLLASGAHVDLRNSFGDTALIKAAECEMPNRETIQALLDAGADIEVVNRKGLTPLAVAVEYGNASAVESLLGRGARMDVRTNDGLTLLQVADKGSDDRKFRGSDFARRYVQVKAVLRARGAR